MVPETATSPSRRATENSEGKRSPKASFFKESVKLNWISRGVGGGTEVKP